MTAKLYIFKLLFSLSLLAIIATAAKATEDPMGLVTALYTAAVKGEGPTFIEATERPTYLSKALMELWAKADAARPADDELGPIDFDVVADTNGLTLGSFKAQLIQQDVASAAVAVTLNYADAAEDQAPGHLRYDLVHDPEGWKIDDIRSANWDLRELLRMSLEPPAQ